MPLYEYQCDACGHRFELIRKFADPPLESCPKCGGQVQKLFSSPAFHLKGSGWYATDYARKPDPSKSDKDEKGDKADKTEGGGAESPSKSGEAAKAGGESTKTDSPSKSDAGSKSESSTKSESAPARSGPNKE